MDELLPKLFGQILDKLGVNSLISALLLALLILEIKRHNETKKELIAERSARVEDLKTVLPLVQASTAASQAMSASLQTMSEGLTLLKELVLSSIRGGGRA